jgi:hypothetical protein
VTNLNLTCDGEHTTMATDQEPRFVRHVTSYLGQHCGWHFFVIDQIDRRGGERRHVFHGIAVPPVDGLPYTTDENRERPDIGGRLVVSLSPDGVSASRQYPPGIVKTIGVCKAEAIYKAVFEALGIVD